MYTGLVLARVCILIGKRLTKTVFDGIRRGWLQLLSITHGSSVSLNNVLELAAYRALIDGGDPKRCTHRTNACPTDDCIALESFITRRRYARAVFAVVACVCPSVCPSQAGSVPA